MKSVKLAVIAALSSFAVSAFALSPMQDSDLSAVSGQDGVTIGANLNIDVGSFVYTDTSSGGGSIAFNGIEIRGAIAVEIDIIDNASAKATLGAIGVAADATGLGLKASQTKGILNDFAPAGDVVRIALPDVTVGKVAQGMELTKEAKVVGANRTTNNLYFGVASIKMGNNSDASFGAMAVNDIKMQGTTALIWAH